MKYFLLWYILGIACVLILAWLYNNIEESGLVVTVDDIIKGFMLSLSGPLLLMPILYFVYIDFISQFIPKIDKDKIIWKSKKAKTNHILFGEIKE
jgi:hypothetical protein